MSLYSPCGTCFRVQCWLVLMYCTPCVGIWNCNFRGNKAMDYRRRRECVDLSGSMVGVLRVLRVR